MRPTAKSDGNKVWRRNGKPHRIDGPAVEYANGTKYWYINGKLHRAGGPAVERLNGHKEWYLNSEQIYPPYSQVLTAVFARGLPIQPEVLPGVLKTMSEADGSQKDQFNRLNSILHKYWPTDVNNILATLFSDSDPVIKQLAFSLLGQLTAAEESPTPRI